MLARFSKPWMGYNEEPTRARNSPAGGTNLSIELSDSARHVLDNIRNRRSLKFTMMKPDPISEEHLQLLFEAANWAPTHRLTEPWRFILFLGEGRARLARVLAQTYRETIGDDYNSKKEQKIHDRLDRVPLCMAIIMRESGMVPELEEILALGCSVQNFHLAAQALGIGCIWSTPSHLDHPHIRGFLNLKEKLRCLGFYYVGYPLEGWPRSVRKPVGSKITRIEH